MDAVDHNCFYPSYQVDSLVETAHRLRLSNQLSDEETRRIASAFSDMTELMKVKSWTRLLPRARLSRR